MIFESIKFIQNSLYLFAQICNTRIILSFHWTLKKGYFLFFLYCRRMNVFGLYMMLFRNLWSQPTSCSAPSKLFKVSWDRIGELFLFAELVKLQGIWRFILCHTFSFTERESVQTCFRVFKIDLGYFPVVPVKEAVKPKCVNLKGFPSLVWVYLTFPRVT